jgi:hypothetical protein
VIATDNNGCKHFQSFLVNPSATGTEELYNENTVLLYPNPVTDLSIIESSDISLKDGVVEITNSIGENILNLPMTAGKTNINGSELKPGIYFFRVNSKNGRTAPKLFIVI